MQRKIFKATPMGFWHLMLEFEDGTKQMVHRGDLERHDPKAVTSGLRMAMNTLQTARRPARSARRRNMLKPIDSIDMGEQRLDMLV